MKIAIFSIDDFIPPAGGAEVAVGEITKRLPDIQFDLYCARLETSGKKQEIVGNVHIFRIGPGIPWIDKLLYFLIAHRWAKKNNNKSRYDLAWSIMASHGGLAALKFKSCSDVPYLLTLQEGDVLTDWENKYSFLSRMIKKIFVQATGLQAISRHLYDWGIKNGFNGKIAAIIPNGVDLDRFSERFLQSEIDKIREGFGFPSESFIIVTISRLEIKNGTEDIIRALKILPGRFCLVICGSGSLEEKLKKIVSELGLAERVKFIGWINHESLPKILKASDVFIRPSLSEGLGNAFLEAMAAGVTTVGTGVGGIVDFLKDESTGFICLPNNPGNIAEVIEKISSYPAEKLADIKKDAERLVCDRYDWNKISLEIKNVFYQVIKNNHEN